MENKELFVAALNAAFVAGDPERYKHLAEKPVVYEKSPTSGIERLVRYLGSGQEHSAYATGDSCSAIAKTFINSFL